MTLPAQTYRVYSLPYTLNCTQRYFSYIAQQFASPVLLQSDALADIADRRGRFDILAAGPDFSIDIYPDAVCLSGSAPAAYEQLTALVPDQVINRLLALQREDVVPNNSDLPFIGGFIAYLSYDFGRLLHGLWGEQACDEFSVIPLAQWRYYAWAIIVDHELACCSLVLKQSLPADFTAQLLEQLHQAPYPTYEVPIQSLSFVPTQSKAQYLGAIQQIKDYISAGDCYQVNYAQCFTANSNLAACDLYWYLQAKSPAPFSAFYAISEQSSILSFSPERFVSLSSSGSLLTQPIKGTVGRSADTDIDRERALQLQQDEKNRAENLMIVDLLRNDFGRIAEIGSVSVNKLFELQSFSNVHHLVSSIEAQLQVGHTSAAIWQHCFPGGSITGAPKKRSMEIIDELEPMPRSIYCGSIVYVSDCGNSDSNILIRSLLKIEDSLYCWGGGGIVHDSTAESEYQESLTKINRLINF